MGGNAICERIIGTPRRELLDRPLIVNEHHLRQVLTEYLRHYNTARPHRGLGQLTPAQAGTQPPDPVNLAEHWIHRKQVLGGLTREYYIAALPPSVATRERRSPRESYFRAPRYAGAGGTDLGEVLVTCGKIPDGDEEAWCREWGALADRVRGIGLAALAAGHRVSARDALLAFDGPGHATTRRLQHLVFRPDWEKVVGPVIDYAAARSEVDERRMVLMGTSFGGFLAARAAAFEHRIAALV